MFTYPSESLPAEVGSDEADSEADSGSIEPLYAKALPLWKRCLDVLGALAGLVLLSPLLLLTALAIKLTSRGPIFFSQLRSGLGGKPFTLHKFRTMCTDAEAQKAALMTMNEQDGPAFKMKNDPRITPLGRFLRKSCIDELPQLVNVLKGDMTLVGPRPLPCDEADRCQAWEKRRLTVTPGLTCSWQAGARRVTFAEWMRMDLRYIRQRTLANDCRLLWKTFLKVIRNRASH
jgi:lipopolysaccharide/colanic/teichoic acid biosynthesis glycosyltransferase